MIRSRTLLARESCSAHPQKGLSTLSRALRSVAASSELSLKALVLDVIDRVAVLKVGKVWSARPARFAFDTV